MFGYGYGYGGYYGFDWTLLLLIPTMIFVFIAQAGVKNAFKTYANVRSKRNITGEQAARIILDANGLHDIRIEYISGTLSDHYDPRRRVMRLSQDVAQMPSVAAVSVAAHESGHAIQHANGYVPLKVRNAIAPAVSIVSRLSWPILITGLIVIAARKLSTGNMIFDIGLFCFVGVVVFHAVTLPVELNASKRAIAQMEALGIVDQEEKNGAKKVLRAAAMTYVASLATALASMIRILLLRGRN